MSSTLRAAIGDNPGMSTAKTVLITGTSSGIGLAAAIATAQAGWHTVATMRDTSRASALMEAADAGEVGKRIEVRQLDVTEPLSVSACLAGVIADHGRLDALVNNAGAGHLGTVEQETIDDVRKVMELNFFGVVAVTRAAFPHLRAAAGRLVTVTSVGGVVGQPFNEAYCAAKFAVEGFMESLAPLAASLGVSVTVIEPAAVASEFVSNVGIDPMAMIAGAGPYATAMRAYIERTRAMFAAAQSPADAAATIVEALTAERPAFRMQTSDRARQFVGVKLADLDGSRVLGLTKTWIT